MFSHTFRRTILFATVATMLLVPAAQGGDSAPDAPTALDPAIATAIREGQIVVPKQAGLDIAIGTAIREGQIAMPKARGAAGHTWTSRIADGRSLDLREAARPARPAAPTAGLGRLDRFHWDDFGLGVGSVLLLASLVAGVHATRRRRHVTGLVAS